MGIETVKKICVVTATRAEYGVLQWLLKAIEASPVLELQLVVTGAHLESSQGMTVRQIEADGFKIDYSIDMQLGDDSKAIACSMGRCAIGMSDALSLLSPDMLVVVGDRYELLPICSAALVMNVPIAHISGGDVTRGAIDDRVRNAVTMMASLHFPGTEASAANIRRMTGGDANIFTVGEPGLESFLNFDLLSRQELASELGLDVDKPWILATLHPETLRTTEYNMSMAANMLAALKALEACQTVITGANADLGGSAMNAFFKEAAAASGGAIVFCQNLGQRRYLGFMHQAACVLGNSSSGILEAPFLGIPVVNIGRRQEGRHLCKNVLSVSVDWQEVGHAVRKALSQPRTVDSYYGDGHTAQKIVKHIVDFLQ